MLKNGGNLDIFDRLYKQASQHENLPSQIMDNIYFLNRHCKFLSYVEKENIIVLLKRRDPQIETTISEFKANKISKEQLKEIFYTILYPKRVTKKHNENLNPCDGEAKNTRGRRSPDAHHRKNIPVAAVKLDLALDTISTNAATNRLEEGEIKEIQKHLEYMNSFAPQKQTFKTLKHSYPSGHAKTKSVIETPHSYENKIHQPGLLGKDLSTSKKLSEIDLFLQKLQNKVDSYTKPAHPIARAEDQNLPQASNIRVETFQDLPTSSENQTSLKESQLTKSLLEEGNEVDDLETVQSQEVVLPKSQRSRLAQEAYKRGRIPSNSPAKVHKADKVVDLAKHAVNYHEIINPFTICPGNDNETESGRNNNNIFGFQGIPQQQKEVLKQSKENKHAENKVERSFSICIKSLEILHQDSNENSLGSRLTAEFVNKENPQSKANGLNISESSQRDDLLQRSEPELVRISTKDNSFVQVDIRNSVQIDRFKSNKNTSSVNQSERESQNQADIRKSLANKVNESCQTFMTSPVITIKSPENDGLDFLPETQSHHIKAISEFSLNIPDMTKLSTASRETSSQTPTISTKPEPDFVASDTVKKLLPPLSLENAKSLPAQTNKEKYNMYLTSNSGYATTPRSLSPLSRDAKAALDNSHYFGGVTEKIFDDNKIYAEDIVDEIFRYLGEYIVNKNYFVQIMTNYLNCLPIQHGVRPKDISTKIFEICDRNGDGLISVNDLGSRATLFSQLRKDKTKEKTLYNILDPSVRGFIIETDIVNALTKAQALACSKGANLFDDYDELIAESRKIAKELDKENKGIITYWDIFLWKDTESFDNLNHKLHKYTSKLDNFTTAKKTALTPRGNKNIFYTAQKMFDDLEMASPTGFKPFSSVIQGGGDDYIDTYRYSKSQVFDGQASVELNDADLDNNKRESIRITANFSAHAFAHTPRKNILETSLDANAERSSETSSDEVNTNQDLNKGASKTPLNTQSIEVLNTNEYFSRGMDVKANQKDPYKKSYNNRKELTRADSDTDPANSIEFPSKKDTETSRSDKDSYRYHEDFEFRESDYLERNKITNSFA